VFDVSGVSTVDLMYRIDEDGENPLHDNANEVFEPEKYGYSGVGSWQTVSMKGIAVPPGNHSGVDFPVLPLAIADKYYVHLDMFSNNTLVDYYVQATDKLGNTKKTDIFHVYIG
jgi:hypothetical protein